MFEHNLKLKELKNRINKSLYGTRASMKILQGDKDEGGTKK